jgi:hypothetical protein
MKVKEITHYLLNNSWMLIIPLFLAAFVQYAMIFKFVMWLEIVSSLLFWVLFLLSILSAIYYFAQRQFLLGLITLSATLMITIFVVWFSMAQAFLGPDHFADDLKIPTDVTVFEPALEKDMREINDSLSLYARPQVDFMIFNGFMPGNYNYSFWSGKIDEGIVYLKAYEITQGTQLSDLALPATTGLEVGNNSDSVYLVGTSKGFMIYEGDPDKPYAARFEVWLKPADHGAEKKLCERVYRIAGWQH